MPRRARVSTLWDLHRSRGGGQVKTEPRILRRRRDLAAYWSEHPIHWLEGVDDTTFEIALPDGQLVSYPKGRPLIWTRDEGDRENPVKPWPVWMPHLRALVAEMHGDTGDYKGLFGDKVRQVLFTLTAALVADWNCKHKVAFSVLWSKITEDQAIEQLVDKVRFPHSMLPDWVQALLPMNPTPANIVNYPRTHSSIRAVAQTAARGAMRGGTRSLVVVDEAAFQDQSGQIISAAKPAARHYWVFTTPDIGTAGAKAVRQYLDMPTIEEGRDWGIPGLRVRWISPNMKVIEIDNEAIPGRDGAWEKAVVAEYPEGDTDPEYLRERKRNWSVGRGTGYFSAFAKSPETYILRGAEARILPYPKEPVHRGRDFGERRPACIWLQRDPSRPRIFVLREWLGDHIQAHDARDVTLYLSGELPLSELKQQGQQEIARLDAVAKAHSWPPSPWFPRLLDRPGEYAPLRFADWTSHEALKTYAGMDSDSSERTDADILASRGIDLQMFNARSSNMGKVLLYLLRVQDDGLPGILFSEFCPLLIEAFSGALQYKKPTQADPEPEGVWAKNGTHDNVVEALGHAVANLVDVDDLRRELVQMAVRLDSRWQDQDEDEEGFIGL